MTGPTATLAVPRQLANEVRRDWADLTAPTPGPAAFDPAVVAHLPPPARRWLTRSISPGTPLYQRVVMTIGGEIRLGSWRPFTATWALAPLEGYVWAARTRLLGLPVSGYDRYTRGSGEMHWRVLGRIPVMSAADADVTRSAADRCASELCFVPPVALAPEVTWQAVDERGVTARVPVRDGSRAITVTVSRTGTLESVTLRRWGNPDKAGFREHVFGAVAHGAVTFDGISIPSPVTAGWWYGTDRWSRGQFIRFRVLDATLR
jgi:hypothetical protein